jgi:hypothetical protein
MTEEINKAASELRDRIEKIQFVETMTDAEIICVAVFELCDVITESTDILCQVLEEGLMLDESEEGEVE